MGIYSRNTRPDLEVSLRSDSVADLLTDSGGQSSRWWSGSPATPPAWTYETKDKMMRLRQDPLFHPSMSLPRGYEIDRTLQDLIDKHAVGPSWPWPYVMFAVHRERTYHIPSFRDEFYSRLILKVAVYDTNTGRSTEVNMHREVDSVMAERDPEFAVHMIRALFRDFITHEFHEALSFDNRLVHNPHPEEVHGKKT